MGLRLTLIGGGGVRVPHVVYGLLRRSHELPVSQFFLYDVSRRRAEAMAALSGALARRLGQEVPITVVDRPEEAGRVDYVLTAIRPGGDGGRARDEAVCRAEGVLAQETTGAVGFFMALRSIPPVVEAVQRALEASPEAWVINFSNPAGLVTEALVRSGVTRAVGVCDTPSHFLAELTEALGLTPGSLRPAYLGLNHLGFFTELRDPEGRDRLPEVLDRYGSLVERVRPLGYFPVEALRALGNLPVEYLHFYFDRQGTLRRQREAAEGRGAQIERLNRDLWQAVDRFLPDHPEEALSVYLRQMAERSATYLQVETGRRSPRPIRAENYLDAPGYHAVAVEVMRGLSGGEGVPLILDVPGGGAAIGAPTHEVYETAVRVDPQGVHVVPGPPPGQVALGLIQAVKAYERLALEAAFRPDPDLLLAALMAHPLVADVGVAQRLLARAAAAGVEGVAGVYPASRTERTAG